MIASPYLTFLFLLLSFYCALYYLFEFLFFSLVDMDAAAVHYFTSGWICMNLCIFQELTLALMVNKLILSTTQISSVAIFCIFHFVHKIYRFRCEVRENFFFVSFVFFLAELWNSRQNVRIYFNCIRDGSHARLDKDATTFFFLVEIFDICLFNKLHLWRTLYNNKKQWLKHFVLVIREIFFPNTLRIYFACR